MAPVIGSDGFSDCNKLCDPGGGYWSSCSRLCKEFKLANTEPIAVHSSTKPPTSSLLTTTTQTSLTGSNGTSNTANDSIFTNHQWAVALTVAVLTIIVLLFLFIFRKKLLNIFAHFTQWLKKRLCNRLPNSHEEANAAIELKTIGTISTEETNSLLEKGQATFTDSDVDSKNREGQQYEANTREIPNRIGTDQQESNTFMYPALNSRENLTDSVNAENDCYRNNEVETSQAYTVPFTEVTGPIQYKEEEFQVISHDSDNPDKEGYDSETDSETSSNSLLTCGQTLNGHNSVNTEDIVSRKSIKKKGVIRVITEINLR